MCIYDYKQCLMTLEAYFSTPIIYNVIWNVSILWRNRYRIIRCNKQQFTFFIRPYILQCLNIAYDIIKCYSQFIIEIINLINN